MSEIFRHQAEEKWLPAVIPFVENVFRSHDLPSHDLSHHNRVWKNACNIIHASDTYDSIFYEKLLLACYFHDTGLTIRYDDEHGKQSSKICKQFLSKYGNSITFSTDELLTAIENHDDKEYLKVKRLSSDPIYTVLVLADDFDAFGAIGVYRYVEIYLKRGIPAEEIPFRVLSNAAKRYKNCILFSCQYQLNVKLLYDRYKVLREILSEVSFNESISSILYWIRDEIIGHKKQDMLFSNQDKWLKYDNARLLFFIKNFKKELGVI